MTRIGRCRSPENTIAAEYEQRKPQGDIREYRSAPSRPAVSTGLSPGCLHTVEEGFLPGDGLDGLSGDDDPVRDTERLDRLRQLDLALAKLSNEHRLIVLLHDTEGYKLEEIHKLTGIPVGTIKSRLHRARARLREILIGGGTFS